MNKYLEKIASQKPFRAPHGPSGLPHAAAAPHKPTHLGSAPIVSSEKTSTPEILKMAGALRSAASATKQVSKGGVGLVRDLYNSVYEHASGAKVRKLLDKSMEYPVRNDITRQVSQTMPHKLQQEAVHKKSLMGQRLHMARKHVGGTKSQEYKDFNDSINKSKATRVGLGAAATYGAYKTIDAATKPSYYENSYYQ